MGKNLNSFDVILISAGGRGAGLARQLAPARRTAVVELPSSYPCEDEEGPFGFFLDSVRPFHWKESPFGFSVKTLEKSFHFKEVFLSSVYEKRIEYQDLLSARRGDFKRTWLRQLLEQLSSGIDRPLNSGSMNKDVSFVFKDFGLLKKTPQTFPPDVSVFEGGSLSIDQKSHSFFHSEQGEIKGKNIVCLLNPEEMMVFGKTLYPLFFPKTYVRPYWCWQRLTYEWGDEEGYPIPPYLVLADPENIPWTHERLICLKKSLIFENLAEVWIKTPYSLQSFEESALKVTTALENYFSKFKWLCRSRNWITPSCLFPLYSEEGWSQIRFNPRIHYTWSGRNLSPNEHLNREQSILKNLL